jgi:hypothetical protein
MNVGMLVQLSSPGMQDTRKAGPRCADAARVFGTALERLGRGRAQALGGPPGMGAAKGAQRVWHGEGAQAVRPRPLCIAWGVQPRRGLLRRTLWTVSIATGMGNVRMVATTVAGLEASPFNIVIAGRAARSLPHDRPSRSRCLEAVLLCDRIEIGRGNVSTHVESPGP